MKFVDLHLHTLFSDGTYTPEELILEAERTGLSAIAVVDHDTVEGIQPTIEIAKPKNIEVVPGIELTAEYNGLEVHILGYLIDYRRKDLIERLDFLKQNRVERIYKMVDKLNSMGVKLKAQDIFDIAKHGTVGRLHIARIMLKEGLVGSIAEAFYRYIGDRSPAYVCGFRFSPREAVNLIKGVDGIPVLAHPYSIGREELIYEFIDYGIMGLEAYYPEHTQSMVNFYLSLAKKFNLLVTGGSDCHGSVKAEVKMGQVQVPYDLVDRLKEAKQRLLQQKKT